MKKIILALAVAAVAALTVTAFASADVARYQQATGLSVTGVFNGTSYPHTYVITTDNVCFAGTGSFTGTGGIDALGLFHENITGSLDGKGNITVTGVYPNSYQPDPGFWWSYTGPLSGGGTYADARGQNVDFSASVTTTNYKNHGDFVSSQADKNDAAHSCIGMPIQSR